MDENSCRNVAVFYMKYVGRYENLEVGYFLTFTPECDTFMPDMVAYRYIMV